MYLSENKKLSYLILSYHCKFCNARTLTARAGIGGFTQALVAVQLVYTRPAIQTRRGGAVVHI